LRGFYLFENEKAFGELISKKFQIGDLVSWTELASEGAIYLAEKEKKFGIISKIEKVIRSEREIVIAKVIETKSYKEKDLLIVCLSIVSKVNSSITS
jgi:hypothetical protein